MVDHIAIVQDFYRVNSKEIPSFDNVPYCRRSEIHAASCQAGTQSRRQTEKMMSLPYSPVSRDLKRFWRRI